MQKKQINVNALKRRDVIIVDLGERNDCVQGGIRPAVIVQNNTGNKYSPTMIVIPMTTGTKKKMPTHHTLLADGYEFLAKDSIVLAEQITTISKKQILDKIGDINEKDEKEVFKRLGKSFGKIFSFN